MVSFYDLKRLLENERDEGSIEDIAVDDKVLGLIRKGKELRKPKCGDFWEDFMALCSDASAMAELLDVPMHKVSKWGQVIQEKIQQLDDEPVGTSDKSRIVPTETEPIANPDGYDTSFDGPADTRPMP